MRAGGELDALRHLAAGDSRAVHARLIEMRSALAVPGIEAAAANARDELDALGGDVARVRERLDEAIAAREGSSLGGDVETGADNREDRRQRRYVDRLGSFGRWLDAVSRHSIHDVDHVASTHVHNFQIERELDDDARSDEHADEPTRVLRLEELRDAAEARASLAARLERHTFDDDEQTTLARSYAQRYSRLMSRIRRLRLPSTRRHAVAVDTRRPETATSTVSLESSRSSLPDSVVTASGGGDMDSELASVASETTRRNAERLGTRSAILEERDVLSDLATNYDSTANYNQRLAHVPLADIRACVDAAALQPLAAVYAHYADVPPRTLDVARTDASDVKTRVKRLSRQRADVLALIDRVDDARERKQLRRLAAEMARQKHVAKVRTVMQV